jgi:hypothetical protein
MQNLDHEKVETNDAIEELKSSITNLTDIAKTLQSLSGRLSRRLSLIGDECRNINSVSKQLQSNLPKMQKSLELIENQKKSDSDDSFWLYKQPISVEYLSTVHRNWSPERFEQTFKKHLLRLDRVASTHCNIADVDVYQVLFNFLFHISKYNGHVYGGLVRDFLVPLIIYGQNINDLDFKDIDIWFPNQSVADAFILSLNRERFPKLIPDAHNQALPLEEYGCGQPFTRKKFYFCFNHVSLFMVDVVIAQQLPVNDFSVNLLMFQAKDQNFIQSSLSCFSVGENPDGDYYKYSVLMLLEMIANCHTEKLTGYRNLLQLRDANYRHIGESRCERMIKWGWSLN